MNSRRGLTGRLVRRNFENRRAPPLIWAAMVLRDIAHYRLANQQIAQPTRTKPYEVVASLGAMQAQDYLGALWGIGVRLPDATEADIERAIADRMIIRTCRCAAHRISWQPETYVGCSSC
jgi:hypothetical protein